ISDPSAVFAGTGGMLTMLSAVRGTIDNVNEVSGTDIPDAAFRWDSSGQQWIFNMATSNLSSGSTYAFRINLAFANITFVVGVKGSWLEIAKLLSQPRAGSDPRPSSISAEREGPRSSA